MVYKVLVVDDSTFYRRRVTEIINEDRELEVVGEARNGRDAIEKIASLRPDVVTMDVEMPIMDGISAVREIMKQSPLPVVMFSSLTHHGAQATLDALEAGALDFLPKKFEDIAENRKDAARLLCTKVRLIARRGISMRRVAPRPSLSSAKRLTPSELSQTISSSPTPVRNTRVAPSQPVRPSVGSSNKHYKCLAIGASTGGPVALQKVLMGLPSSFPYPIILVQHMPGTFTHAFAQRLDNNCQISVKEAEQGDVLKAGCAYLAPGGKQMLVESSGSQKRIKILETSPSDKINYKPSVDLTFGTLAKAFGGDVLGIILTGMGADGREGCRVLKGLGATIWAQDQASCVVYGMPQAVASANISTRSISLDEISSSILAEM